MPTEPQPHQAKPAGDPTGPTPSPASPTPAPAARAPQGAPGPAQAAAQGTTTDHGGPTKAPTPGEPELPGDVSTLHEMVRSLQRQNTALQARVTSSEAIVAQIQRGVLHPVAPAAAGEPQPFRFSGTVGHAFNAHANEGASFGDTPGILTVNGQLATVQSWRADRIKGQLPVTLTTGKAVVTVNGMSIEATI